MKTYVYHHNDFDGKCAGAIIALKIKDAKFIESDHTDKFNFDHIVSEDVVYVLDFSFSVEDFKKLMSKTKNIIWIDHHITAIKKCEEAGINLDGLREDTLPSGAMLTWEYMSKSMYPPPLSVTYISLWDTWKHNESPDIINFINGLSSKDHGPQSGIWEQLFDGTKLLKKLIADGAIIESYAQKHNEDIMNSNSFEVQFESLKGIACNLPKCSSRAFKSVEDDGYDIFIPFLYNGNEYVISLYKNPKSDINTNLGEVAMKYGGGGHPSAAGFSCDKLPFSKNISTEDEQSVITPPEIMNTGLM